MLPSTVSAADESNEVPENLLNTDAYGLSDSVTKSYEITFSATYNCSKSIIANATWGTSSARTLTYSGTWTVPETNNGKSVKKGYLHMRPEYNRKQYDVYSRNYGTTTWVDLGTAITKRAYSVDIYKTFVYN